MQTDQPKEIRKGEELDITSLKGYLEKILGISGEIKVSQFPSGFSNLTYLVATSAGEYILRRPPFGAKIKSAHDMSREFRFLKALEKPFTKVPKPVFYCEDENVIGAPFYLMQRVSGVILRGFMKGADIPSPDQISRIAYSTIQTLAELHQIDIYQHKLDILGKAEGYVKRQVEGWNDRYDKSRTDDIGSVEEVRKWLKENIPAVENTPAIIHNDFKYDNLVLDRQDLSTVIAVLDWEMATIGDPLMDLGTTLGYWIEPTDPDIMKGLNLSPSYWPGNPTRQEVANYYQQFVGCELNNLLFYYVYGLFKISVIVQQIYYRYQRGFTQDPRFANLIDAVKACGMMASKAIDQDKISG